MLKDGLCKEDVGMKYCQKTCSSSDILGEGCCRVLDNMNECASAWGKKYCRETCSQYSSPIVMKCSKIVPLGMQSGAIPDARITASSMYSAKVAPSRGRLYSGPAWAPRNSRVELEWIQVDLGQDTKVAGIATQGRTNEGQWVKRYKLQYSSDGKTFKYYKEGKVFAANTNKNTVVKHDFDNPIIARYIRVLPWEWQGFIALRMELYGCHD
ncbi:hypothetical protein QZH41_000181 [Actinostola sp. cb2023]|nr:hypothetical protein QZH41_000181 [Actinostola sp. cb2023]